MCIICCNLKNIWPVQALWYHFSVETRKHGFLCHKHGSFIWDLYFKSSYNHGNATFFLLWHLTSTFRNIVWRPIHHSAYIRNKLEYTLLLVSYVHMIQSIFYTHTMTNCRDKGIHSSTKTLLKQKHLLWMYRVSPHISQNPQIMWIRKAVTLWDAKLNIEFHMLVFLHSKFELQHLKRNGQKDIIIPCTKYAPLWQKWRYAL